MKRIKILACFLVLGATVSSCDDFLSEVPDNRTFLDNEEKIAELLVNAYPTANFADFAETMSDNAFDSELFSLASVTNTQNFEWAVVDEITSDTPSYYWEASYASIAHANTALEAIEKLGGANTDKLKAARAEALLTRAYAHFMLVNLWGKTYNPATADTDLGVPYVETVETELLKDYKRATVGEIYTKIEADIEEALTLGTGEFKQPKFHFNANAAKAFAARFFLFKGDWERVLELSDHLGAAPGSKIRDVKALNELASDVMAVEYSNPSTATNLLMATVPSGYMRSLSGNRFNFTVRFSRDLFGEVTNPFSKAWSYYTVSFTRNNNLYIPRVKEYFKMTNPSAGTGFAFVNFVLLTNDELFLNRMEAHVMTNQIDLAIKEYEYFIRTRTDDSSAMDKVTLAKLKALYPNVTGVLAPFYSLTEDQSVVLNAIADARRREFYLDGMRWLDVRRFNMEVTHKTYGKAEDVLTRDDLRRQLQIPLFASDRGVEKNPR